MLDKNKNYWFLGANHGGNNDQTNRFISSGIWENGYKNKYLDVVRSIAIGDKVAIKSAYTQKHNLPFDNQEQFVSVMEIKAIGTVTKNYGDGKLLEIDWEEKTSGKKWFFYTNRTTIWLVKADSWQSEQLINFTFFNEKQDIKRFCNAPYWRSRFGATNTNKQFFKWTHFYEAIADKLSIYSNKSKRPELMRFINNIASEFELSYLTDKNLHDICPFTALGSFNRGITEENRKNIAQKWAEFLDIEEPVPDSFEGIPLLNNQNSWFFSNSENQQQEIDNLWQFYIIALKFADYDDSYQNDFIKTFDLIMAQPYCGWKLSIGLFWIRPNSYATLDSASQHYIKDELGINIGKNGFKGRCSAEDYISILNALSARFSEDNFPVHSYPELSLNAWKKIITYPKADYIEAENTSWQSVILNLIKQLCKENNNDTFTRQDFLNTYQEKLKELFPNNNTIASSTDYIIQELRNKNILQFLDRGQYQLLDNNIVLNPEESIDASETIKQSIVRETYALNDLISEGCFVEEPQLQEMISCLKKKKNIILQGPPGTGKTWLAKRLASVLIGFKDSNNIKAIQFHPNISYEDFIRGYRPTSDGKLSLIDGSFLEIVNQARNDTLANYVVVIEEINRGNPAQIFGEMLTLLESDKRTPSQALELTYRREYEKGIFIPENLYVIGTMNLADRSLAMVDFALRRRFAFFHLSPNFGDKWLNYMIENTTLSRETLVNIQKRIQELNNVIADDRLLGKAFTIGHSYFTCNNTISEPIEWFKSIINSEIRPLLEEYWFDEQDKVTSAMKILLTDFEE